MGLTEIIIYSGVVPALVSALIAFKMQKHFLARQQKREEQKVRKDRERRKEFILRAFLLEANYNLSLAKRGDRGNNYKLLFDTRCYDIFKEDAGLLEDDLTGEINKLYLDLYEANSNINGVYGNNYEIIWSRVAKYYERQEEKINKFKELLESKIK